LLWGTNKSYSGTRIEAKESFLFLPASMASVIACSIPHGQRSPGAKNAWQIFSPLMRIPLQKGFSTSSGIAP
jgi:hypothetical protein